MRRLPPDLSLAPGLGDVQDRCPADGDGHCSVAATALTGRTRWPGLWRARVVTW